MLGDVEESATFGSVAFGRTNLRVAGAGKRYARTLALPSRLRVGEKTQRDSVSTSEPGVGLIAERFVMVSPNLEVSPLHHESGSELSTSTTSEEEREVE